MFTFRIFVLALKAGHMFVRSLDTLLYVLPNLCRPEFLMLPAQSVECCLANIKPKERVRFCINTRLTYIINVIIRFGVTKLAKSFKKL